MRPCPDVRRFVRLAGPSLALAALAACSSSRSRANEDQILRSAGLAPGERAPGVSETSGRGERELASRPLIDEAPSDVRVLVGTPTPAPVASDAPAEASELSPTETTGQTADRSPVGEGAAVRPASAPHDAGFVDAVVGQINGRPVYASEFFAPMDARLRADAARMAPNQWRQQTAQAIRAAVIERMREELILAEFQAQLTPEARQGLFAFVEQMRQRIVAENLGSESLADRRIGESEGLSLDEKVRQQRDREIIRSQLTRAIGDRMYVSWREVELAYERDFDQYNPPRVARLRMIQTRDEAAADAVRAALGAGEAFEDVARAHSAFRAEEGGLWTIELDREGYASTRIFAPEELNSVAVGLKPGEVSEPFEWSGSTVWLTLEAIEQPRGRSLYEAQLEILNRLREERFVEEQVDYFAKLFGRASVTDVEEMTRRLFAIAEARYLSPPEPGGQGG